MNELRDTFDPEKIRERIALWMAANGYTDDSDAIPAIKAHEMFCQIYLAISSAKAAEEDVETDYFMEFQNEAGQWFQVGWSFENGACSHFRDEAQATAQFSRTLRTPRRLMKRERTETNSVIEVREKEGL